MSQDSSPYQVSESGMSPVAVPSQLPVAPTPVPKIFGIIHIIYASLGILIGLGSIVAMFAVKAMVKNMGGEAKEAKVFLEAFDDLMIYSYIDGAFKLILGCVLLTAGIGLLKKKLWAQKVSLFWAVARIVIAIVMVLVTMGPAREFQDKVNQMGSNQQEQFQQMAQGVGNVMGIFFICIYPVLTLIFLSKKNVKDSLS